jgi:hypothetical protein
MNKLLAKAKKMKQKKATWYLISEPAPTWVGEDEESLTRPFLTLVADLDRDVIRHVEITERPPDEEKLLNSVLQAVTKPGSGLGMGLGLGLGGKYRPTTIQTSDTAVLAKLQPLTDMGIECQQVAKPQLIVNMLHGLEQQLTGRPYRPGLLAISKVTEPLLRELYTAAAEYFVKEPWDMVSDSEPIAIRFPPEAPPQYAVIMGYGGEEFGLAIYNSAEDLALVYSGVQPEEMTDESVSWLAALYDWPHYLPFDELDAIAAYDWPIAAADAYPFITRLRPTTGDFEAPTEAEIRLLAAALRTIPRFAADYLDEDGFPQSDIEDVVYELSPMYGHQTIALNWAEIEGMDEIDQIDFDDLDEEKIAEMGMAAVNEFIDGWNFDEENYEDAMGLGAFLLAFIQMVQIQEPDRDMDDIDYLVDVCWEVGAMVIDQAERPIDLDIFSGPARFIKEYTDEVAEDEDDVESYQIIWEQLGHFAQLMASFEQDN